MTTPARILIVPGLLLGMSSCSPTGSSEREAVPISKEIAYLRGHQLFTRGEPDSALSWLEMATRMDSLYLPPVRDLAMLFYERASQPEGPGSASRSVSQRTSMRYFARAEALGDHDADTYERLCELAVALGDDRRFLTFARKSAERFPFDRQYFNLGVAQFENGDYAGAIESQRRATEKFKDSPYVGAFYRQLGRAYMKVERNQTAERILSAGVRVVETRLIAMRSQGRGAATSDLYRRLTEDKVGMLLLLKHLYQVYRDPIKLADVERQLKESGHSDR